MDDILTISAKKLGWLAQPDFCERCFYMKSHLNWKQPWAMAMPIYMTLDKLQKKFITDVIDATGKAPPWMSELGDVVGHIEPPNYRQFFYINSDHGVRVWGNADLIPVMADGSLAIVDLKTAKPKGNLDHLASTYLVQQNAYALAAEYQNLGKVKHLALLYMTAMADGEVSTAPAEGQAGNMVVPFAATLHRLEFKPDLVDDLCGRFRELSERTEMPDAREGCKDCQLTEQIHLAYAASKDTAVPLAVAHRDHISQRELYARHLGLAR
ncbi:MAG: PD-(D/E)XK nuclease family protein [Phycisphaeraceae bacterium]